MKQKKCKNCKELFTPIRTILEKYCTSPECIKIWIDSEKQKQWNKRKSELKKNSMTLQDHIKIAQSNFNYFIRLRDAGNNCISCGKKALKENAGHYFNANNHWSVRFDERNVHLQCEYCNTYLSGNLINYRDKLIEKIGIGEYNVLCEIAKETRKYSIPEVIEISEQYKEKINLLKKKSK